MRRWEEVDAAAREGVSDTVQQREREERTREMKKDHRGSRASKPPPATDEEQTVLNHSTILPERPLKGACKHATHCTVHMSQTTLTMKF